MVSSEDRVRAGLRWYWVRVGAFGVLFLTATLRAFASPSWFPFVIAGLALISLIGQLLLRFGPGRFYAAESIRDRVEHDSAPGTEDHDRSTRAAP